ncbi:hypothetical protein NDU88_007117 [Pleurodeles waltl]|uniref:Uncharacterized protein n=1 Tax=Pleurodeles waltl TaxID=8319 RepID=A0AAV7LRL4_PLEWA|nr:hypothetical protein NDU88_007117 [Pleurodeles waltl]
MSRGSTTSSTPDPQVLQLVNIRVNSMKNLPCIPQYQLRPDVEVAIRPVIRSALEQGGLMPFVILLFYLKTPVLLYKIYLP